jgi:lipoate-protein ligase B
VLRLGLVEYTTALQEQQRLISLCRDDGKARLVLLEHPHTYTLGVRAREEHLLAGDDRLEAIGATVQRTDRGGDITYHGPGQLVGYPILNLRPLGLGPLSYVRSLEAVLIAALDSFSIDGRRRPGRPGVWLGNAKIASIGVRVSRGITSHGFALNVDPDLDYFAHIVPCGLTGIEVTSMMRELGSAPPMHAVADAVVASFATVFNMELRDGCKEIAPSAWTPTAAL